jgi:hypothetical protein
MNKQDIVNLLKTNDRAVARALIVLNDRQTQDEQSSEHTKHANGRGFRPCHAYMGTNMANFFKKFNRLSEKQIAYWRVTDKNGKMRIEIYAGQLLEEAELKAKQKVVPVAPAPVQISVHPISALEEELASLEYMLADVQESDDPVIVGRIEYKIATLKMQINEQMSLPA